jgi:DNA polymerase III alpha subunit (gram-positive type)
MLAFDIETTGLDSNVDHITAASVYDPRHNIQKTFIFPLGDSVSEFVGYLDNADKLCAFNGAAFDIPFIEAAFALPPTKTYQWRLKLFDLCEMSSQVFHEKFSLNQILLYNNIDVKTSSGKEAIQMARRYEWDALANYCMHDTIKTWQISNRPIIKLPIRTYKKQTVILNQIDTEAPFFDIIH